GEGEVQGLRINGEDDEEDERSEADQKNEQHVGVSHQRECRDTRAVGAAVRAGVGLDIAHQRVELLVGHHTRERRTGNVLDVSRSEMEARGIEPRSEHDSDTATTCVDRALWSRYLGAPSALVATSLFNLLRHSLRPQAPPARLCDT